MTPANIDNVRAVETRRRYCLQAMGMDLYVPRISLPGAKNSILVEPLSPIPESNVLGVATSGADKGEISTPTSPAQVLEIESTPKTRKAVSQSAISAQATSVPVPSLRFQLRAWRVEKDLLVVDSRDREVALPTETLLRNMMAALGYKTDDIGKSETLRWPFVDSKKISQSDPAQEVEDARAMVRAFIEAQHQKHQFPRILLLGATATKFALPDLADAGLWKNFPVFEHCQGIVLPSLAELLRDPSLKKNTWHAIRHLHRNIDK
jgi:hypothetical protein